MKKKFLILLSAFLIASTTPAGAIYDTWTPTGPSRSWTTLGCSTNCITIAAAGSATNIWVSRDGGGSWSEKTTSGSRNWSKVVLSSDGGVIIAAHNGGYLYRSADSGETWSQLTSAGSQAWRALAVSSDGNKIIAGISGGAIWTSSDSGANWILQSSASTGNWISAALTSDGAIALLTTSTGKIIRGTGGFATWSWSDITNGKTAVGTTDAPTSQSLTSQSWTQGIMDSTGNVVAAVSNDVYLSSNAGANWVRVTQGNFNYRGLAGTSDLKTLIVVSADTCNPNCRPKVLTTTNFTSFTPYFFLGTYQPGHQAVVMADDGARTIVASNTSTLFISGSTISTGSISVSTSQHVYRNTASLTATLNPTTGGRVTFYVNGKRLAGCISRVANGSSFTCNWRPSVRGSVRISARFTPFDSAYSPVSSQISEVRVGNRASIR